MGLSFIVILISREPKEGIPQDSGFLGLQLPAGVLLFSLEIIIWIQKTPYFVILSSRIISIPTSCMMVTAPKIL